MANKTPTSNPFEFSEDTENQLNTKRTMIREGANDTDLKDIRKVVSRSIRKDKRQHQAKMVNNDLDIRDQYMGFKNLRRPYTPIPLSMKDAKGKHVPLHARAQAAGFLRSKIWGHAEIKEDANSTPIATESVVSEDLGMDERNISMEELLWAIKKLKRGKAAGPDGISVDVYKQMNEKVFTEEPTRAQVVLLFKKGNNADLGNYRPISLLNTTYNIYTAILQMFLADVLDTHLQTTQYGFRRKKSTAQAVHYVRRVMGQGAKTQTKTRFLLLD